MIKQCVCVCARCVALTVCVSRCLSAQAVEPGDLSLQRETIVEIIDTLKPGSGWYTGRYGSMTGILPGNYVQILDLAKAPRPLLHMPPMVAMPMAMPMANPLGMPLSTHAMPWFGPGLHELSRSSRP